MIRAVNGRSVRFDTLLRHGRSLRSLNCERREERDDERVGKQKRNEMDP